MGSIISEDLKLVDIASASQTTMMASSSTTVLEQVTDRHDLASSGLKLPLREQRFESEQERSEDNNPEDSCRSSQLHTHQ